jgi:uncharacterized protein (DUF2384 family)
VAEIVALACHASNGAELIRECLRAPHSMLGDKLPFDWMDTVVRIKEVATMLVHVEHGMPV